MPYQNAIRDLRARLVQLDRLIAGLLELERVKPVPARRATHGRKAMGEEERQRVSIRMKRYWASRRQKDSLPRKFPDGFSVDH